MIIKSSVSQKIATSLINKISNTQTSPSLNYILQFYICKISISETETIVMIQFEIFLRSITVTCILLLK